MDYSSLLGSSGGGGSGGGSTGGPVASSANSSVSFGSNGNAGSNLAILAGIGAAAVLLVVALLVFQKN